MRKLCKNTTHDEKYDKQNVERWFINCDLPQNRIMCPDLANIIYRIVSCVTYNQCNMVKKNYSIERHIFNFCKTSTQCASVIVRVHELHQFWSYRLQWNYGGEYKQMLKIERMCQLNKNVIWILHNTIDYKYV